MCHAPGVGLQLPHSLCGSWGGVGKKAPGEEPVERNSKAPGRTQQSPWGAGEALVFLGHFISSLLVLECVCSNGPPQSVSGGCTIALRGEGQ